MIQKIQALFETKEEIPLFYVESGSRLWGIASPDSDFDVRGFHLQSKRQYFDFKKHRDIIEKMDGDFDFVSYDLDKMFGLIAKSNPTVFEWIRSHLIYFNNLPNWSNLQNQIVANFDFQRLFYHYLSLSKGHLALIETNKKFTYKTLFYCLRGLLSVQLAAQHIIPELLIDELFKQFDKDSEILHLAKNSLERKKQKTEKEEVVESEKPKILTAIKKFSSQLATLEPQSNDNGEMVKILQTYSFEIKSNFYK